MLREVRLESSHNFIIFGREVRWKGAHPFQMRKTRNSCALDGTCVVIFSLDKRIFFCCTCIIPATKPTAKKFNPKEQLHNPCFILSFYYRAVLLENFLQKFVLV